MLEPTVAQQFDTWAHTAGGRRILQMAYAITAPYAQRFLKTQRSVSAKLIWEILRYNLDSILARRGYLELQPVDGFRLNNNFTCHLARHILAHKPEWKGLFHLRELKAEKDK